MCIRDRFGNVLSQGYSQQGFRNAIATLIGALEVHLKVRYPHELARVTSTMPDYHLLELAAGTLEEWVTASTLDPDIPGPTAEDVRNIDTFRSEVNGPSYVLRALAGHCLKFFTLRVTPPAHLAAGAAAAALCPQAAVVPCASASGSSALGDHVDMIVGYFWIYC